MGAVVDVSPIEPQAASAIAVDTMTTAQRVTLRGTFMMLRG
jgi:hypothetical protein